MVLANITEADPERSYLPAYHFQIRRCGDEALLGGCTLRVGENAAVQYSGHIGYAVAPEHRGHRYAAKAVLLLLPLGFRCGLRRIIITCQPDNLASAGPACWQAELFGDHPVPSWHEMYRTGRRMVCRYLFSSEKIL